ncbi:MAG: VOC family protein [Candidatus Binatia bacterium]
MRIRQVALVARELEPVVSELCSTLRAEVTYRDPLVETFGLENALVAVGSDFIEVVSPVREDASAARFLERNGGDGGYMIIVQTDDVEADRRRVEDLGVRIVWEIAFEDMATIHLHPRDVTGAILSFDEPRPPQSWRWAGTGWERQRPSAAAAGIRGVELRADSPKDMAARWAAVLAAPVDATPDGSFEIALDPGTLRVVQARDGEREGVAAVALQAVSPQCTGEHRLGGVRFRIS